MLTSANNRSNSRGLLRELRLRDAVAIVAGTIIGSGIFLVPGNIANQLSSFGVVILVWLAGGLLSLFGALALGELGAAFPKSRRTVRLLAAGVWQGDGILVWVGAPGFDSFGQHCDFGSSVSHLPGADFSADNDAAETGGSYFGFGAHVR